MSSEKVNVASELAALQQETEAYLRAAEEAKRGIEAKRARLCEQVRSGTAHTGSRITDFLFAIYGSFSKDEAAPWEDLQEKLVGQKGQLILAISHKRERWVCRGPMHSSEDDYQAVKHYALGLLSDEELVLDTAHSKWGFPMKEFVRPEGACEFKLGPLMFSSDEPVNSMHELVPGRFGSGPRLQVFVGDEVVLGLDEPKLKLRKLARRLGKELPEIPEEVEERRKESKEMCALLNKLRETYRTHRTVEAQNRLENALKRAKNELNLGEDPLVKLIEAELAA